MTSVIAGEVQLAAISRNCVQFFEEFFFEGGTTNVLPPLGELASMKEQNINKNGRRTLGKLEKLPNDLQAQIAELAINSPQIDVLEQLRSRGFDVHASTLSRFLRKHRAKALADEGRELKETVADLAAQGKEGLLREGSLQAVRQRLFERALTSKDGEEARELFGLMQKEDAKVKELELEARKVAVAEEQVRLQAQKLAIEARRKVGSGFVVETELVEERERRNHEILEINEKGSERERLLLELVRDVAGILNRGGDSAEGRLLEARMRLGAEVKLLEGGT